MGQRETMEMKPLKLALLLAALLATTAHAEGDGLVVGQEPPVSFEPGGTVAPPMSVPTSDDARDAYENPPERRVDIVRKDVPTRFDLDNRTRFRKWIHELCKLEPVNPDESARTRFEGKNKARLIARNKQGSLRLILENYVDDVRFETACAANPASCHLNPRKFSGAADTLSALKSGRKASDIAKLVKDKRLARQQALKTEFFDLRDAGSLDGKSTEKAEEILRALKEDSSCRTRSVQTQVVRSVAQK